jgi:hypothetical protein
VVVNIPLVSEATKECSTFRRGEIGFSRSYVIKVK